MVVPPIQRVPERGPSSVTRARLLRLSARVREIGGMSDQNATSPSASTSAARASRERRSTSRPATSPPTACGSRPPSPRRPRRWPRCSSSCSASFPDSTGSVGVTVPAVVRHGVVSSAANIDTGWIGTDADALFTKATGRDVHVVNDADAAGLAEVRYGAAKGRGGLVIVTTLGTGIGSAIVYDGVLVPNSELGHLEIDGHDAEKRAASSVKEKRGPHLPGVGQAADGLLPDAGEAVLPRPDRGRRRGQQGLRRVPAPDRHRDRDRAGQAAEPRRDRRGRAVGGRGRG